MLNRALVLLCCLVAFHEAGAQVRFTENKGQWDANIRFKADLGGATLFFTPGKITWLLYNKEQLHHAQHDNDFKPIDAHAVEVVFEGANTNARFKGQYAYSDYANYFRGADPSKWKSNVRHYQRLVIEDIYPSVDFEIFESSGALKYNFIVKPGGNPALIKLKYIGADSMYLDNGQLKIVNSLNTVTEMAPVVYTEKGESKTALTSAYTLEDNVLSFVIDAKRNKKEKLIIDPVLVFSSFSGSRADNFGYTATYDDSGYAYSGGTVFDVGFPTTPGAFQMMFAGGEDEDDAIGYYDRDCGILKYTPDGKKLIYATYIGGTVSNEQPHSMIVNSRYELLVMGSTKSPDFPIGVTLAYDDSHNGNADIFVVTLSNRGDQLVNGTFIGGTGHDGLNGDRPSGAITPLLYNYADDFRGEIIIDKNDYIYVASSTASSNFPTKQAFDPVYSGRQEGCFFKLSPRCDSLLLSTYIGGSGDDAAYGLDLGNFNDVYITGGTTSLSFNYSAPGMQANNTGGRADGYLLRMKKDDGTLMAVTMMGTNNYDQCYFVKTDKYGKPFVYGQSMGNNSVSPNVYSNTGGKQFIKKFNKECSVVELETVFGATGKTYPDISPTAFLVDECERIFISGWGAVNLGGFRGGGTTGMPLTPDALQKKTDGADFYVAVFSKNLRELLFGTYFGGQGNINVESDEHVDGGTSRFDKKGIIYQSVCGGCGGQSLFPTTTDAWSRTNNSSNCNNAIFKIDFENLNRKPKVRDSIYEVFVTDTLAFYVDISDQDIEDSLRIELTGTPFTDTKFPKPLPFISGLVKDPVLNKYRVNVTWHPGCQHEGVDTTHLYVKVYDRGCPTQDSNKAHIKIVVKEIPLTPTPETFCLNFRDNGTLKLSWKSFPKNRYFKYVLLYRRNPNGQVRLLDTLKSNDAGEYIDIVNPDPRESNFTYFMEGVNLCNRLYTDGIKINTLKEFNTPIDSTYLNFATVVDNSKVKISWFVSKEEDFGSYDVFRADNINNVSGGYRKIYSGNQLMDTTFTDDNVKVQDRSYCYRIGVNDKCGHVSKPSNEACNIVLKGEAGPLFFDLNWSPYRLWIGGVKDYELIRKVDTGSLRYLVNTGLVRVHHDIDLDLWWGAYYYQVRAYEGVNAAGEGFGAVSESNQIRLIQPPMVFVPNAFSPNSDGSNDVWGVSHAFVKDFEMKVFNRWGQKVWQNDFKGTQWDGKVNGAIAGNDVYIWIVTYRGWDNKFYTQKGTVTVMQ